MDPNSAGARLVLGLGPAGSRAQPDAADRAAHGVLVEQVEQDAGEVQGVLAAGGFGPRGGQLAATLAEGRAAQRNDLEAAGVELGTKPGAGATLDGQGGGERGGKPEVHTERVHTEAGPDGAVRDELCDDAG